MSVHVHAPKPCGTGRRIMRCPRCKTRRRFIVKLYVWYGAFSTCCACGSQWSDGEYQQSTKASRTEAKKRAQAAWREVQS